MPTCRGAQVWNVNSVSSIVGVFNIQGASWDRKRRRFHIHDAAPPALWTRVRASDVWPIASSLEDGRAQVRASALLDLPTRKCPSAL